VYEKPFKDVRFDQVGGCMINIQHYLSCNLRCSYCSWWKSNQLSPPRYPVQRIIDIYNRFNEKGKLLGGSWIQLSGGEPTTLEDLDALVDGFIDLKMGDMCIFTNCVEHSDVIEMYLRKDAVFVTTSIDAGIPSTFKKIRGGEMQSVIDTLVKYRKTNTTQLRLKYIITKENSNEDELFSFIFMMLALRPDLITITPEFPCGDARIPPESAVFGARLWYHLRKYGGFTVEIQSDTLRADPKFASFSSEIYEEFNRLCAETPLTDEFNLLEGVFDTRVALPTKGYVNELRVTFESYVKNDMKEGERVAMWGFGAYGKLLCNGNSIVKQNISIIIDGDEKKQGLKPFNDKDIIIEPPEYLIENRVDTILITAAALHKSEIEDYIKRNIGYEVKILS